MKCFGQGTEPGTFQINRRVANFLIATFNCVNVIFSKCKSVCLGVVHKDVAKCLGL
jgi:hypothetical protein